MSDTVIKVSNLSKKYLIQHQQKERYTALRDVITSKAKSIGQRVLSPFRRSSLAALSPSQEEFFALKDVSFEIKRGDRVGIIGRNGAGKSTLLKVLSRITEPTTGRIEITGRVASLLEVGTGFHPELTGRENIFLNGAILGMTKAEIKRKFDEIVDFAEIEKFLDTPVKRYSSGMYVRLAFAVAAHLEPEILIVDEVLAVGDAQFQKKCLGKMEEVGKEGRTVLFVSHNMSAVESLCSTAVHLHNGLVTGPLGISEGIKLYLDHSASNIRTFSGKIVTKAEVLQVDDKIAIYAEYHLQTAVKRPSLGFVISDYFGHPICGGNPVIDEVEFDSKPTKFGAIRVLIDHPKLLNGTYRLSLWFSDGREDFFEERDCLSFDVINMITKRQLPVREVGPVYPSCKWDIAKADS